MWCPLCDIVELERKGEEYGEEISETLQVESKKTSHHGAWKIFRCPWRSKKSK